MPRAAELSEAARRAAWDALWRMLLRPRQVGREDEAAGAEPAASKNRLKEARHATDGEIPSSA